MNYGVYPSPSLGCDLGILKSVDGVSTNGVEASKLAI
jgi:hypothetical protein